MMSIAIVHVTDVQVQGFRALNLTNQVLSLTLVPELGGKICSLCDLRTGREWLWTNPHVPYRKHSYGASYVQEADTGGWDECFPTIAPCSYPLEPWSGRLLPDHGELWSQPWSVEVENHVSTVLVHMVGHGVAFPYVFQRTISMSADAPKVRFEYSIKSLANTSFGFIWSAHPLFTVEAGMRILLPERTQMKVWLSVPPGIVPDEDEHSWPVQAKKNGREWDLSYIPDADAKIACKLWSQPLSQGYAALVAHDGEFRFTFDPSLLPQIGLWVNAGAWSGMGDEPYYNLALEPCIGAQDSLAQAIEKYKHYVMLSPHEVRNWWLDVHLNTH